MFAVGSSGGSLAQAQQTNFLSDCRVNTVCGVNMKGITVTGGKEREGSFVKGSQRMSVYPMSPRSRHCLLESFGSQEIKPWTGPANAQRRQALFQLFEFHVIVAIANFHAATV